MIGELTLERRRMDNERRGEDRRMDRIEKQMTSQAEWLRSISDTLNKLAVQEEKLRALAAEVSRLRDEHQKELKQQLNEVSNYQQTCPRTQVKWIWAFVAAPLWLVVIGAAWQVFSGGI